MSLVSNFILIMGDVLSKRYAVTNGINFQAKIMYNGSKSCPRPLNLTKVMSGLIYGTL